MKYNNQTYRNLQDQVWYLTNYLENEAQLVELGIRVVGAQASLPIPEGAYNYGDAYMIGTEAPFTMYVWTRANESHPEDYWFEVGPFPMPGPQGKDGSIADITSSTTTNNEVTYDSTDGAHITGTTNISFQNSAGETQTSSHQNEFYVPIAPGDEYLTMDADPSNTIVQIKVDKPSLALDFYQVAKPSDGSTSVPAWDGTKIVYLPYTKEEKVGYSNAFVKTGNKGEITANGINFTERVGGEWSQLRYGNYSYFVEHFFLDNVTKDLAVTTSSTNSGTLDAGTNNKFSRCKNLNVLYRGYSHIRQTPTTTTGIIKYVSTECGDNTITVRNFILNTQSRAWTWEEKTFPTVPTYKHTTQMHVVIPGDDNYYLTIFNTDKHGAMYNLNSASTLLDNIGTAGTMAYKQNTANAAYIPIHISKTSSGNWEWNMGSASGTFTTAQIDTITDDYETIV